MAGNAQYLYWAPAPAEARGGTSRRQILVRAVREHDATGEPLPVGDVEGYREVDLTSFDPRTDDQRDAFHVEHDSPVREVSGPPGTGKTVALLYATRDGADGDALYVTWSSHLADGARSFFAAHGLADRVQVRTFRELVNTLGVDLPEEDAGQRAYRDAVATYARPLLGPWLGREDALWAELRGVVFGLALPFAMHRGEVALPACTCLADATYVALTDLDAAASSAVLAVAKLALERGWFGDLAATRLAIERVRDALPTVLAGVRTIAVDEAQDLAPVEHALLLSLVPSLRRAGGDVHIYLCGDASQTLRPTAFAWGAVGDLAYQLLGVSAVRTELVAPLRQPRAHVQVLDAASELYRELGKELRPAVRRSLEGTELGGQVWIAPEPPVDRTDEWLAALASVPGRAVVTLRTDPASERRDARDAVVFRPEDIKGLERALVVVVGLGDALRTLRQLSHERNERADRLAGREARRLVDRIRVALSRSTDTLVLLDDDRHIVDELVADVHVERLSVDELCARLCVAEERGEERAWAFLDEARELAARGDRGRAADRLDRARAASAGETSDTLAEELRAVEVEVAPREIDVHAGDGDGLRRALAQVADGGVVRLAPGIYEGEFVITKQVTLLGVRGKASGVVVRSSHAHVLFRVQQGTMHLSHVSLVLDGARRDEGGSVVYVEERAEVTLEECDVTSAVVSVLVTVCAGGRAVLSRSRCHDSAETGILLNANARGEVER